MKTEQVVISAKGAVDVLQLVDLELADPGPEQIRIKNVAAGVSFGEILMRTVDIPGLAKVPFAPGSDAVGVVEKVGSKVTHIKPGDRVAVLLVPELGGYSRHVNVDAWKVVPVPDGVDSVDAAAVIVNYLTAYQMIHYTAKIESGETVLVHNGGGGVGTALLELLKLAGVKVVATGSARKQAVIEQLGAAFIDYTKEDFVERLLLIHPGGVDAVFDPIGSATLKGSYKVLKKGGRLLNFGFSGDFSKGFLRLLPLFIKIAVMNLIPDGKKLLSYQLMDDTEGRYVEDLRYLFSLLVKGDIKPVVSHTIPLEEVGRAHTVIEERENVGKVVLLC